LNAYFGINSAAVLNEVYIETERGYVEIAWSFRVQEAGTIES
jgi:hypothetical protein